MRGVSTDWEAIARGVGVVQIGGMPSDSIGELSFDIAENDGAGQRPSWNVLGRIAGISQAGGCGNDGVAQGKSASATSAGVE